MNIKKKDFFILCPPPNVTGYLHIGHALTFAIQNCFARANKVIEKRNSFLLPGYDHGGISTFYMAQKEGAKTFEDVKAFAERSKGFIKEQFRQLQLFSRDDCEEYTMGPDHYKLVQETFVNLYNKGLITREKYIVNYDPGLNTVLSDMEINTEERDGKLYEVHYKLDSGDSVIVATTRPETIFADVALAVNPNDERYKHLIGSYAKVPIIDRRIPILAEESVAMDFGTGVLKITPAHSPVDFQLGKKHNLPMINIMGVERVKDNNGNFINLFYMDVVAFAESNQAPECNVDCENEDALCVCSYIGDPQKVRDQIANDLQLKYTNIKQSVPVSSKSGAVIECFLQDQWFLNVKDAAEKALTMNLRIEPEVWKNNYTSWLKNINEKWCISRQIPWGHKIPVWYSRKSGGHIDYSNWIVSVECPGDKYVASEEVLDTWFSSALWPILYKNKYGLFPSSVLVTAYDILFFWVARMVLMSMILTNELPFESVFIHGLVRDEKGLKMSKTRGNVINPTNIINEHGYDVLSYSLISKVVPNGNINFDADAISRARSVVIKLQNAVKFYEKNMSQENNETSDIGNYFLNYAHVTYNEYREYLKNLSIHQMLTCATEYLYFICDYLIEFSKIDHSLLQVLNVSLKTCLLMMYGFIPNISGELWLNLSKTDILEDQFEPSEFGVGDDVVNLIKFIKKIRSMSSLKIMIYENNENVPIIRHMCHIKISNTFNCQMLGYKLYIENIFLLHDEIYVINDKLRILSMFFQKSQKDRVPPNIWAQKELDRDDLLRQKSEIEELIKSNKNN